MFNFILYGAYTIAFRTKVPDDEQVLVNQGHSVLTLQF